MTINRKKIAIKLGMSIGTAQSRLRKMIMFQMVQKLGLDICFRCGKKIEKIEDLSIEHKIPWLNSNKPKELFWDLSNIAFSHLSCNSRAGIVRMKHPSISAYRRGCRCSDCQESQKLEMRKYRKKVKELVG